MFCSYTLITLIKSLEFNSPRAQSFSFPLPLPEINSQITPTPGSLLQPLVASLSCKGSWWLCGSSVSLPQCSSVWRSSCSSLTPHAPVAAAGSQLLLETFCSPSPDSPAATTRGHCHPATKPGPWSITRHPVPQALPPTGPLLMGVKCFLFTCTQLLGLWATESPEDLLGAS